MSTELVFNLWAFFDAEHGHVCELAARAYNLGGSDDERIAVLKSLSRTDWVTATRQTVPQCFRIDFDDGRTTAGAVTLETIYDPDAELFADIRRQVVEDLPAGPGNSHSLPSDPLCSITILYQDGDEIRPLITEDDKLLLAAYQRRD